MKELRINITSKLILEKLDKNLVLGELLILSSLKWDWVPTLFSSKVDIFWDNYYINKVLVF